MIDFEASKVNVPECSKETPTYIKIRLINEDGFAFTDYATWDGVEVLEQIIFPTGTYQVDEISLVTETDLVTHTVPSPLDNRFDFTAYAQHPLPYYITIHAE